MKVGLRMETTVISVNAVKVSVEKKKLEALVIAKGTMCGHNLAQLKLML